MYQEAHGEEEGREEHPGVGLHGLLHPGGEQQHRAWGDGVTGLHLGGPLQAGYVL